jgi:tol-pal system protein YbgF
LQKDVSSLKTRVTNLEIKAGATRPNTTTSITPAGLTEKSRYDYAYSVFKAGDYNRAIAEFQSIIQTYPTGEYADNSMYWSGEAFLKKGDKVRAMQSFDQILRTFPKSPKAADALLKLGITQASIGNKAKAKEYYDYLITTYPGTPSANNAYSKRLQLG